MVAYEVSDGPKMLRETLCVAQTRIGNSDLDQGRRREHIDRLQRLIDACDVHRPLGRYVGAMVAQGLMLEQMLEPLGARFVLVDVDARAVSCR